MEQRFDWSWITGVVMKSPSEQRPRGLSQGPGDEASGCDSAMSATAPVPTAATTEMAAAAAEVPSSSQRMSAAPVSVGLRPPAASTADSHGHRGMHSTGGAISADAVGAKAAEDVARAASAASEWSG